jgi:uncharacterized protein
MTDTHRIRTIRFHVGGPNFHPVARQAEEITAWLGDGFFCSRHHDKEIFDHLEDCDLLVLMGLFCTPIAPYEPLKPEHEQALHRYISSGRPLLLHHGAIASYDDSEAYKRLIGINWVWGGERPSQHSPFGQHTVRVTRPEHPVMRGVTDFSLHDELYYDIVAQPSITPQVLAVAPFDGRELPMVQVFSGGRIEGAGDAVYLANGHDMEAFKCPALRQLWVNAIHWLLRQQP